MTGCRCGCDGDGQESCTCVSESAILPQSILQGTPEWFAQSFGVFPATQEKGNEPECATGNLWKQKAQATYTGVHTTYN